MQKPRPQRDTPSTITRSSLYLSITVTRTGITLEYYFTVICISQCHDDCCFFLPLLLLLLYIIRSASFNCWGYTIAKGQQERRKQGRKEGLLIKFHPLISIFIINLIILEHIHDQSWHSMIFFQVFNVFIILQGCSLMFKLFRYFFVMAHGFA